jgi:hypothetical protein
MSFLVFWQKKMGSGLEISVLGKMIFQDLTLGCDPWL